MLNAPSSLAGCEPVRVSQVEAQIHALETISHDLNNIVGDLTQKLHSVTRGQSVAPESPMKIPEEMLVPLASNLRDTWRNVNNAVNRLREMSDQIELPSA